MTANVTWLGRDGSAYVYVDGDERQFLILPPKARRGAHDSAFLLRSSVRISDPHAVSDSSGRDLSWIHHPASAAPRTPVEIAASWSGAFDLNSPPRDGQPTGLRKAQLGAVHAVSAHWTVSKEPATIVMPTGTGKTETMMSLMVQHRCATVLVLVPSNALRRQTFEKFSTLGSLKGIGVVGEDAPLPRTGLLKKGFTDVARATEFVSELNVVIATPQVLESCSIEAREEIAKKCSHLFVDEAHHLAAKTWDAVKTLFADKPVLQFSATPFRNDRQPVEGKIIYNYPLRMAQDDGIFKPIDFRPVNVDASEEETADRAIANAAVVRLREDRTAGFDHLLMARVRSKRRAEVLAAVYAEMADDLNPVVIYSGISAQRYRERLNALRRGDSRVLICVNMFGEGFDLPQLKIAAVHDKHQSLPVTLQFIGRFTRSANEAQIGDASLVLNVGDEAVNAEVVDLYAQDADWNDLLRRSTESRIEREVRLQDLIDSFRDGHLPRELPLWNLRPANSAIVYQLSESRPWTKDDLLAGLRRDDHNTLCAVSNERKAAIAVWAIEDEVKWGRYRNVKNLTWHIVIAYLDERTDLFFVHASDYGAVSPGHLVQSLTGSNGVLVSGSRVFRAFHDFERPMARTVGASKTGSIRFTMYFGPDVTEGLSQVDRATAILSNVFAWGYEDGERKTLGCSVKKGKIWALGGGAIDHWIEWCQHIGQRLSDEAIDGDAVFRGFLRPKEITERPDLVPLAIEWGERLMEDVSGSVTILQGDVEYSIVDLDLLLCERSTTGPIRFKIASDRADSTYELVIGQNVGGEGRHSTYRHVSGPAIRVKRSRSEAVAFGDYLERDPLVVTYVDNSFSYNHFFVEVPVNVLYPADDLDVLDWAEAGINIQCESEGQHRDSTSIQHWMIEQLIDYYDVVFNDDGKGEIADIVAIRRDGEDTIHLHLVYCKYSSEPSAGARLRDMYEVCGQAMRSVKWKPMGLTKIVKHLRPRESAWKRVGHTRFRKGNWNQLKQLETFSRRARLVMSIEIVQPGLSQQRVTDDILRLLGSVKEYVHETARAPLQVLASDR